MGDAMAAAERQKLNHKRSAPGAGRGVPLSDRAYHAIAETFRALADPTRARIVHLLSFGERSVNQIAEPLTVTPSAVSQAQAHPARPVTMPTTETVLSSR